MQKSGFTAEFFEGTESEVLKRVNDFKSTKDEEVSSMFAAPGFVRIGGQTIPSGIYNTGMRVLDSMRKRKKGDQQTQTDTSSSTIADSTFLNQTIYRDPSSGDTFPASALVGAGQQDTTTKAMIDSVARVGGLVKVQSAPVTKKEAAKKRKQKKDKKKMPGYEKRYRRLVNAARTERNTRELNKLEEQYPNLIQLNLRGN